MSLRNLRATIGSRSRRSAAPSAGLPVSAIDPAHRILEDRSRDRAQRKRNDLLDRDGYSPVLLVFDEITTVRRTLASTRDETDTAAIESMITDILVLGRELGVQVV